MRVAFIDADDTLWRVNRFFFEDGFKDFREDYIGIASDCYPPFTRIGKDKLVDRFGTCTIELLEGSRDAIQELRNRGYKVIMLSSNKQRPVQAAVRSLDLDLDDVIVGSCLPKGRIMQAIKSTCNPDDIIFIDDSHNMYNVPKGVTTYSSLRELFD